MNGTVAERLKGIRTVGVDSLAFIYLIEQSPNYLGVVRQLFEMVESGSLGAVTSHITLLEVLVLPLRKKRADLVSKYRDILVDSRSLVLCPVDRLTSEKGAEIRASFNIPTPDAIQLATAELHGAQAFITNDKRLKRYSYPGMEVLLLDDFLPAPAG